MNINERQRAAILTDELAIEQLPHKDRDELIGAGYIARACPRDTPDHTWRSWLTPEGLALRARLLAEAKRTKEPKKESESYRLIRELRDRFHNISNDCHNATTVYVEDNNHRRIKADIYLQVARILDGMLDFCRQD